MVEKNHYENSKNQISQFWIHFPEKIILKGHISSLWDIISGYKIYYQN